jgi:hypothetical protein
MYPITTETIAKIVSSYTVLIITGERKSGRSLIATDILNEKIKINSKMGFCVFTNTSQDIYKKYFSEELIFSGNDIKKLDEISRKIININEWDYGTLGEDGDPYTIIIDDCDKTLLDECLNSSIFYSDCMIHLILIPKPNHIKNIDWKKHGFAYQIKANKEKSIFEADYNHMKIHFYENNDDDTEDDTEDNTEDDTEAELIITEEELNWNKISKNTKIIQYSYKIKNQLLIN